MDVLGQVQCDNVQLKRSRSLGGKMRARMPSTTSCIL